MSGERWKYTPGQRCTEIRQSDSPFTSKRSTISLENHQCRRVVVVVQNRLIRDCSFSRGVTVGAGVQIPTETREIAAANVDADPVPRQKTVTGIEQFDPVTVRISGLDRLGMITAVPESGTNDSFA